MADVVIVGCLFTFLLINTCSAGLHGLNNLEYDGSPSTQASDNRLPYDAITVDKMMVHIPKTIQRRRKYEKRFQCYQCESPDCENGDTPSLCRDALSCYKATVRASDGALSHSRGCSGDHDHQFSCRTIRPPGFRKRLAGGQRNITCCNAEKCNTGEFPSLPTPDTAIEPLSSNIIPELNSTSSIYVKTIPNST